MKGPGIRLDLDVRRAWECPECGKRRRVTGETISVRCNCTKGGAMMKLVETQRQTRSFTEVIERVQQASQAKGKKQRAAEEPTTQKKPTGAAEAAVTEPTASPTESPSSADDN